MTRKKKAVHGNTLNFYKKNLRAIYADSTFSEKREGLLWYHQANFFLSLLSERYSVPLDTVCKVCAVLSPTVTWEANKRDTETLIKAFKSYTLPYAVVSTYGANKTKAIAILEGKADLLSSAKKTYNFYRNLLDPLDKEPITIDRHAIKAMYGTLEGGGSTITAKQYEAAKTVYALLAEETGLTGAEFQATVWLTYKNKVGR